MVSSSPFYVDAVNSMVAATNMAYRDFLKSEEGQGFRGEVNTKIILRQKNNLYAQCNLQFLDTLKTTLRLRGRGECNPKHYREVARNIWFTQIVDICEEMITPSLIKIGISRSHLLAKFGCMVKTGAGYLHNLNNYWMRLVWYEEWCRLRSVFSSQSCKFLCVFLWSALMLKQLSCRAAVSRDVIYNHRRLSYWRQWLYNISVFQIWSAPVAPAGYEECFS